MAKSKLIAIGCSYTEGYGNKFSDRRELIERGPKGDFTRWPAILADKLNMECINLGRSGMAKLIDTLITEKNIGLVVIMWSEWQRMDFQFRPGEGIKGWISLHPHRDNIDVEPFPINREGRIALLEHNNVVSGTMRSLRFFLIAQKLLEDIPYLMLQGCAPLVEPLYLSNESEDVTWDQMIRVRELRGVPTIKTAINQIINSPKAYKIDEDKFIGWPLFLTIGGYCVDDMLDKIDPYRKKYRISAEDTHPNKIGHEIISKEIYKVYKKIYVR